MKVSVSWIQNYLGRTMSAQQVADALAMAGIEIEQIMSPTPLDDAIIVGHVKKVIQHPNADRLRVATVDVAGSQPLQIVCGAPNLAEGQKVAVSQIGATLPDGTRIAKADLRGVTSHGMLCSVRELGLGEDHDGIWVLDESAQVGSKVSDLLPHGAVLDMKTAANRYDLLSMIGLAAEVSAHTGAKLQSPELAELKSSQDEPAVAVVQSAEHVGRFMLAHISIKPGAATPDWVVKLLAENGQRSLGLSVDVTNFIMFELGQPLHAFDAAKVKLPIIVRHAKDGETLVTLDGIERKLTKQDLVIADASGPISLAGIKGGLATAVTETTKEILLEAATFDAATIRKSAIRHGLRTDGSARFERRIPVQSPEQALGRALYILREACGSQLLGPVTDVVNRQPVTQRITVSAQRIAQFLSLDLDQGQIARELDKQGFVSTPAGVDELVVDVPWWRPDVVVEEDIAEEVVKLVGYPQVPSHLPAWRPESIRFDARTPQLWRLKAELKATGLFEVATYSFISPTDLERLGESAEDYLRLKNPLSSEQAYLRRSMLASLIQAVARNQNYAPSFGLFELSRVFLPKAETGMQPDEPMQVAVAIRTPKLAYRGAKAVLDRLAAEFGLALRLEVAQSGHFHPVRYARILLGDQVVGQIGEVHPDILDSYKLSGSLGYLELDVDACFAQPRDKQFRATSKYPSVTRDVAVVVPRSVSWQSLSHEVAESGVGQPEFLSDYYSDQLGSTHKSLAFRLELSDPSKTLTDAEADQTTARVVRRLHKAFGAELRS